MFMEKDFRMFAHYRELFNTKPDFDGINEGLSIFIPRFDYYITHFSVIQGRALDKDFVVSNFSGGLKEYISNLYDQGAIGHGGRCVNYAHYMLRFPELNLDYLWIPKNACTEAKKHLALANSKESMAGIKPLAFHEGVQERFGITPSDFSNKSNKVLALFRDPVERIVSCYVDKICKPVNKNKSMEWYIEKFVREVYAKYGINDDPRKRGLTFLEFVYYISNQSAWAVNEHWRPQSDFVRGVKVDHFVLVSDLVKWLEENKIIESGGDKGKANVSMGLNFNLANEKSGEYSDVLPSLIPLEKIASYNEFVSPFIFLLLKKIYKDDYEILYRMHRSSI